MPPTASANSVWPQPRHLAAVAGAWSLFVVYGSLTPFDFQPLPWEDAARIVSWIVEQPLGPTTRGDWVTNVLLLVPLGYAALGACLIDGDRPSRRWVAIGLVLGLGLLLSCGVEIAQLWFPPRHPSKTDVLAQTLGNVLGMGLWLLAGQWLVNWVRRELAIGQAGRAAVLLQIYVAGVLLFSLLPLDLTIRLGDLWGKYKAGMVVLVPFAHWKWDAASVTALLLDAAVLWPIGTLAAVWPGGGRRHGMAVRWLAALAMVALIEFAQLFVRSRFSDVTDLIVGAVAVSGGLWVAWLWMALRGGDARRGRWIPATCLLAVVLLVATIYLAPFELAADHGQARQRLGEMFRVPLEILRQGEPLAMAANVLRKLILFGILGWLTAETMRGWIDAQRGGWLPIVSGIAAGFMAATLIEVAQAWLPPHVPEVTDILWGALGGGLGASIGLSASADQIGSTM